jgi:Glycosyl transferases group 1
MRILQIIDPAASEFEKKCQRVDFAELSPRHQVTVTGSIRDTSGADIAHVYGAVPSARLSIPYVASAPPAPSRLKLRPATQPAAIVSPAEVPEAVEERYFAAELPAEIPADQRTEFIIATFARRSVRNAIEQTITRIHRFRDDVTWKLFERVPTPEDLAGVDVWVDPAIEENDLDGFVAEAIAAGKPVAASRIAINAQRLENGRTGFLVPRNDPNELTHAILAALFKPEVARSKIEAARQTAGKFRPRQRSRVLERIYETVIQ